MFVRADNLVILDVDSRKIMVSTFLQKHRRLSCLVIGSATIVFANVLFGNLCHYLIVNSSIYYDNS